MSESRAGPLAHGGDVLRNEEPAPFSVTAVMESVRDIVHPIAEEKRLTIHLRLPERDYRLGRQLALRRILLNLVGNALKFTEHGSVELTARDLTETDVEFSVRDTGPGIAPEAVESLFHPFRSTTMPQRRRFSSTGLGLAVSRRLVEALDGTLQYETSPDWGTRFWTVLALPPVLPSEEPREAVDREGYAQK